MHRRRNREHETLMPGLRIDYTGDRWPAWFCTSPSLEMRVSTKTERGEFCSPKREASVAEARLGLACHQDFLFQLSNMLGDQSTRAAFGTHHAKHVQADMLPRRKGLGWEFVPGLLTFPWDEAEV